MADPSEFDRLTKAAKDNYIRLEPQAAQDCAKMCSQMITELDKAINDADHLATVQGFGTNLPNATDLAKRYNDRANNGDSSLKYALTKHREVVNDMLETFISAGRAYLQNEHATTAAISTYDSAVDAFRPKKP
ncbi:hypothetical protein F3087_43795 [Nocardia colli]|uniref:PE domain-containing protein n=1 Tax=Nocardia colli TaxID=2545717 RepID=A0A5N0DUQ6_9NOCA|nr:hypothetical protein [Nocardia colli]KAA8879684.1 hypothetical protein F3087_43795 [Nocardia colli]